MIVCDKADKNLLIRNMLMAKITFHEKFEARFITIYYKTNMMFIIEFLNEGECDRYIRKLTPQIQYHTSRPYSLQE